MAEQPTAGARPGGGKKTLGLTRTQWLITGGVFVAVVGYILWKRHTAGAGATSTAAAGNCTDAAGNSVPCAEQGSGVSSGALTALQDEIDSILGQGGGGSAGSGGGGLGGGGTSAAGTTGTGGGTGTATSTGTLTGTGGGNGTGSPPTKTAGAVTGLKASGATKSSFRASWNAAANATGYAYIVRDLASHTQVKSGRVTGTSVTVSGLKSGTDYNFGVQALLGGVGSNIHVRTT